MSRRGCLRGDLRGICGKKERISDLSLIISLPLSLSLSLLLSLAHQVSIPIRSRVTRGRRERRGWSNSMITSDEIFVKVDDD
jgi:hypothetical protein